MALVPRQVDRPEMLDLRRGSSADVQRSLADLRRLNTYLGGTRATVHDTLLLLRHHGVTRARVVDIGTGAGDIPRALRVRAAAEGVAVDIIGIDNQLRHLAVARQCLDDAHSADLVQADAFHLPLRSESVDVVISTLFLHHFRPPQIIALLRECHRVCRIGWVMNDLVRSYVPIAFLRLTWPVFARSYITRHDGIASIRRGYTPHEMRGISACSGINSITVQPRFPYRMSVVAEKPR